VTDEINADQVEGAAKVDEATAAIARLLKS
jgi:hypothetical protein